MQRGLWFVPALVAGLVLAGCGGDDDGDGGAADGDGDGGAEATLIEAAETELGDLLVDEDGFSLYFFTDDSEGESTCTGGCAETWPPVRAEDVEAGDGVEAELTLIEREDGSMQVAAAGLPLYRYAADAEPGDVKGQGVGGVWFAAGADGESIRE